MAVMISKNAIDNYLWRVEYYLMRKCGSQMAKYYMYPLNWYIDSGRASTPFIRAMMRKRHYLVARILMRDMSFEQTIKELKRFLDIEEVS